MAKKTQKNQGTPDLMICFEFSPSLLPNIRPRTVRSCYRENKVAFLAFFSIMATIGKHKSDSRRRRRGRGYALTNTCEMGYHVGLFAIEKYTTFLSNDVGGVEL